MLAGLQGSGKTTLAAKLGLWLKEQGHSPLLVAADLQRPNAVNQLQVVGQRAGVHVFAPEPGQRLVAERHRSTERRPRSGGPILDHARRSVGSTTSSSSTPPAGWASTPR